ncbi:DUF418 domain-containing protein [Sphingomonas donggukensis]|uniref:DUF418 domain-containing protein n=1 Tax=Sphingomonas donggukensis TaxID=2949093 RepID=A0ABY4TWF2_9SPHN|nr:DUF418 domain-containing protein [Sphingomonas donggukensis]URW76721.1 DUF418 domain-containing protein [Sphingomonas donggukensis]
MTDTVMTTATEPDGAPRVAGLDILRGLAILGILFMNINDMGGSIWAFWAQDIRHMGWSQADQVAWWLREVFADGTARCLLEMLFGVGMVILTDRAAQAASSKWAVLRSYYWRNIVLFVFGLAHVFILLWPGDILHTYGLAALVAVWFRRLGPKWLLGIGLSLAVLQLGGGAYGYLTVPGKRAEVSRLEAAQKSGVKLSAEDAKTLKTGLDARAKREEAQAKDAARIPAEDRARSAATGTFDSWARSAWDFFLHLEKQGLEIAFVLEAATTMLIGAALYKWGIIQGARSRAFYVRMTLIAYAFGLGSRAIGAFQTMRFDDAPNIMWSLHEVARVATTLGHVGLVYVLLATVTGAKLLKPFEAAGRTALTIYIAQTMICLWILYPPFALGLYGTQGWMALMLTAAAVNIALLIAANWYVDRYRIAPVEWAWRSIIAGRALPFRKGRGSSAGGGVPVTA